MWPYPWTHVGTPSHLGHMDRVAATMPSQAHAGAAQETPDILSPRKLHPLFSPKHLDFVTEKNSFFCHLENTVFQTLLKNAFFIRFAHFLLFLGGSNNHSLVQNQRDYRSFSPKKHFVG